MSYRDISIRGLLNVGNSCFLNSVVQALASLSSFVNFLGNLSLARITNDFLTNLKITLEEISFSRDRKAFFPPLINCNEIKEKFLLSGDQHDAHEFFTFLVEQIEKSILADVKNHRKHIMLNGSRNKLFVKNIISVNEDTIFLEMIPFLGKIESSIYCCGCNSSWVKSQNIYNLSLYPPHDGTCSVVECLSNFAKSESVNGVICRKCQYGRTVTKKLTLSKLPEILCLHFNRVSVDSDKIVALDTPLKKNHSKINFERTLNILFITNHSSNVESKVYHKYPFTLQKYFSNLIRNNHFYSISSEALNGSLFKQEYMNECSFMDDIEYDLSTLEYNFSGRSSPSTGTTSQFSDECSDNEYCVDDMEPHHFKKSPNDYDYILKAVIAHEGNHERGHYICYRSDSPESEDGNWVEVSDSKLKAVSFEYVKSKDAFMMFYQKQRLQM